MWLVDVGGKVVGKKFGKITASWRGCDQRWHAVGQSWGYLKSDRTSWWPDQSFRHLDVLVPMGRSEHIQNWQLNPENHSPPDQLFFSTWILKSVAITTWHLYSAIISRHLVKSLKNTCDMATDRSVDQKYDDSWWRADVGSHAVLEKTVGALLLSNKTHCRLSHNLLNNTHRKSTIK